MCFRYGTAFPKGLLCLESLWLSVFFFMVRVLTNRLVGFTSERVCAWAFFEEVFGAGAGRKKD